MLAPEVVHVRIGADSAAPWAGTSPLRRARLSAELLHAVESALAETFEQAPVGSAVVPMPESSGVDLETFGRSFRGQRGRMLMHESVNVSAAGGPVPQTDMQPMSLSPDLSRSMTAETWAAARASVAMAYGLPPVALNDMAAGAALREVMQTLAVSTLHPVARIAAAEIGDKLGSPVQIDPVAPLAAADVGGRARAFATYTGALAAARAGGVTDAEIAEAQRLVEW